MKINDIFDNKDLLAKPYIIAEVGVNHEGSMDLAKRLIDEAKEGGAHAVKFQTYKAETLASKHSPAYWDQTKESTDSQYKLFKKYDGFWKKEYVNLAEYCQKADIEFMSTPFDVESANFLSDLMPLFKISSSDLTNHPFIEYMCKFNKPIILSTGASYNWEIQRTLEVIEKYKNPLVLMHCILNYPTLNENANLGMLLDLKQRYSKYVLGYSDHTLPLDDMETLVTSTLLGSKVIEKHFTHDKTLPGNDHYHAMDKEDLKVFNKRIDNIFNTIGSQQKFPLDTEEISRDNARRSLVLKKDLKAGDVVERTDLTWKRPGSGISPSEIEMVIGRKVLENLKEDDVLQWNMLS